MTSRGGLLSPVVAHRVTAALLAWYQKVHRDLPWRQTDDPYRIWVSEIMLQQTQVDTVIPYYEGFIEFFPTACELAAAELDEVLAFWQGLGYYARARNLYRAAQIVCQEYDGHLPSGREELLALPGIGEYTVGAIRSIAFGQPALALDANQRRVLCRLYDYAGDPKKAAGKEALRRYGRQLLSDNEPGQFNQAVMELGALLCSAADPSCSICPLRHHCRAYHRGVQAERPLSKVKAPRPHKQFAYAYCTHRQDTHAGSVLIVRRPPLGLLGGLWELPGGEVEGDEPPAWLQAMMADVLGGGAVVGAALASVEHGYTHFSLTATVYACEIEEAVVPSDRWDDAHWLRSRERDAFGLTGVTVKMLEKLAWPQGRLF